MIDPLVIRAEYFHDSLSHKAALACVEFFNAMNDAMDEGCLVFNKEERITGRFVMTGEGVDMHIGLASPCGKCTWVLVGDVHDATSGKIWLRKKEIHALFEDYCIVEAKHVKPFKF